MKKPKPGPSGKLVDSPPIRILIPDQERYRAVVAMAEAIKAVAQALIAGPSVIVKNCHIEGARTAVSVGQTSDEMEEV